VNRRTIKKWALYAGLGILMMLIQEHLLARLDISGIHPMVGGVLTAAVAMFEGGIGGASFGLFVGVLQDSSVIGAEGYYSLLYLACGMTAGFICEYMFRKNIFTALMWSFFITAVTTLIYFLLFFLITGRSGISALWRTALPEIVYSSLMLPFVYFPVRYIAHNTAE
jgi:rod shape-determining protein MreD